MLSPGSPSKWQVQDSLSLTPSLLYNDSDQTEDELEVFSSESKAAGVVPDPKPSSAANGSSQNSKSPLTFVNQRSGRAENVQTGCSSASPAYTGQTSTSSERIPSEGNLRFARKCAELHGYIRPLLELLKGLKTGRYDKGLSTFQQSVAIDRLRRIVGVLQKPDLGEKYMGTLLQLEIMLKVWFPQVRPQHWEGTPSFHNLPPRWNQDQLHIPVKKRRLSWSDSDSQGSSSSKRIQEDDRGPSPSDSSSWLSSSDTMSSELEEDSPICTNQNNMTSETKLIENRKLQVRQKTSSLTATGRPPLLVIPPPATDGSSLGMQDCWVSSTTPTSDPPVDTMISKKDLGESAKEEGPKKQIDTEMLNIIF
ncbi:circadian-associated transcriptional repressor-like [Sinocyclocheilus rhinocerous]|uniref:Circadian-associated transcriptional repressor-like n=1 Tax=Sinocyclocheilus rhinocerous TaxID=307959 RepID=A0A673IDQ4_9TELE|nr:PREDICTED: circadian-associated transcriptional repressor-like [Sinocyclocheilus rhinocerous]XP_016388400.1 PREDICTED: circadian-associated transcriptional repressor-like [Sinocyclocheilus rhinocerous]XP_016388401.1 PREDICTED: circadian-associated transcriptional repressor-like [Sinocyclocheilus rhinocerous]